MRGHHIVHMKEHGKKGHRLLMDSWILRCPLNTGFIVQTSIAQSVLEMSRLIELASNQL